MAESAADGSQFAGQGKFTGELVLCKPVAGNLSRCCEDAQRDRQIETAAFLGQIGGRQVDGNASCRKIKRQFSSAERTRSLLSLTSASGRPTIVKLGKPFAR
jgi:hypothetical protein